MKILISGHTSGIGKAIADKFSANNYEVIGFSRSNNRDLTQLVNKIDFCDLAEKSDVIVLNADLKFDNVQLLYNIYNRLKNNKDTSIIVIGSHSTETTKNWAHLYQIEKLALEEAARQLQNVADAPYIGIVRPGYVDTPRVQNIEAAKMNPDEVANIVYDMVRAKQENRYKMLNTLIVPC
jgi:NAD(P)-dependent dehydrogenase (short-subunit alcohol dehydrogenase family)